MAGDHSTCCTYYISIQKKCNEMLSPKNSSIGKLIMILVPGTKNIKTYKRLLKACTSTSNIPDLEES